MNRTSRTTLTALTLTGLTLGGVGVAHATDPEPAEFETRVVHYTWVMPGSTGQKVLPQYAPWRDEAKAAPGSWCQRDRYEVHTQAASDALDALLAGGILLGGNVPGGDGEFFAWGEFVPPGAHGCPADVEPDPEPPVVVPPVVEPPAIVPPAVTPETPATPTTPKSTAQLSVDQRAQVEAYAHAHGIAPEAVLVEMG